MAKIHPLIPDPSVRWDMSKYLNYYGDWTQWGGLNDIVDHNPVHDPFTSDVLDQVLQLSARDTYMVSDDQFRPDLISYRVFGHTQYWQIILFYNGILDVGKLIAGTELRHPSLTDLEAVLLSNRSQGSVVPDPAIAALKP